MKHAAYILLLFLGLVAGCAFSQSVISIAPRGAFNPGSEAELLAELNRHLPFVIKSDNFVCRRKTSGLVGWAVVKHPGEKDILKDRLRNSTTLRVLEVEELTPEVQALLKEDGKK